MKIHQYKSANWRIKIRADRAVLLKHTKNAFFNDSKINKHEE